MTEKNSIKMKNRESEKGSALVIVLMVAALLLVASMGVLLQASMLSANVADMNAEQQAYTAAESGIQTALNVLRGNTTPNPLIDSAQAANHPNNQISFSKAIKIASSNLPGDTSTNPRLSRWMNYDYTPSGLSNPDRVTLDTGTYSQLNGSAYTVEIIDPDNPQKMISLVVTGKIDGGGNSKTFGSILSSATITYNSSNQAGVDVSIREANINLGSFTITTTGLGAFVPTDTRFEIKVEMTAPFKATKIVRGTIKAGYIGPNTIHNVELNFDSSIHLLMGSVITIPDPIIPNAPDTNGGKTDINATVTLSEPIRLLVRSTGYGPRGAKKVLEAMVQRDVLNGGLIPSTLTMVGDATDFVFNPGLTNYLTFSGDDLSSNIVIPPVAATTSSNLTSVLSTLTCGITCNTTVVGNPANVTEELPDWLSSTAKLNTTVNRFKEMAQFAGRYYQTGSPRNFGNNATGKGITFIDGDAELSGSGGGTLIVTGKLTLKDNFNFNGIIVVTGADGVKKIGTGDGVIVGNMVIAPYNPTNTASGYLSPKFDTSGGAASSIILNANVALSNLTAGSVSVLGVAEK